MAVTYSGPIASGLAATGEPLEITATTSGGAQTLHTCHATAIDRVEYFVNNPTAGNIDLTFIFGTTEITVTVLAKSAIIPWVQPGTGSLVAKAYGSATGLVVTPVVSRRTET